MKDTLTKSIFALSLLLFCIPFESWSQKSEFDELKSLYSRDSEKESDCGSISFQPTSDDISQIVLIRHGKPMINKKGWFTSKDARQYSFDYDRVEVFDFSPKPFCIKENELDTLYSSNLVRAVNTASKILDNSEVTHVRSALFREFEREVFLVPILRMPLNFWLITSRLMWYARLHSRHTESFRSAKNRVAFAANFLEKRAELNGKAVLVAHGMFNNSLSNTLQKEGWTLVYENGNGYLSLRILAKKNSD